MPAPLRHIIRPWAVALIVLAGLVLAVVPAGTANAAPGDIVTVAGNGTNGFSGDGGPAKLAQLAQPDAVGALPGGAFLIADGTNCVIRRVSGFGQITTVAGTPPDPNPHCGFSGDGGAATAAMINYAWSIAPLPGGGYLFDDSAGCVIRKVSKTGIISTVAGTPPDPTTHCGFSGDNGPATSALLGQAGISGGVAMLPGGGFLLVDGENCLIRKVSATGIITTVAGLTTGAGSFSNCHTTGDGGPATAAQIQYPVGVATFPNGGYVIPDFFGGCRIRKVSSTGKINEGAGTGVCGYSGDGGPAISAQISHDVTGTATFADGSWLIADSINCIVRKVSPAGRIATVAGTPPTDGGATAHCGYTGDGHPATAATLSFPTGIATLSDGGFMFADSDSNVIRRVIGLPPRASITRHPKASFKTKHQKVNVTFAFIANEVRSRFACSLDGSRFAACRSPKTYRVKRGAHTFRVRATNEFGAIGAPASFTFQVKRKHKKH